MAPPASILHDVRMTARFLRGLGPFLRGTIDPSDGHARLARQLRDRGTSLLQVVRDAIYAEPSSPYFALLRHAGVEYGDVARLVATEGVEGALGRLHAAGVHVTLDEVKGRRPLRRGSLEIATSPSSFDNPLPSRSFAAQTGGSRGPGRRLLIDLDLIAHEACYEQVSGAALTLLDRPKAVWRPVPPGTAGLKTVLRFAKIGAPFARWFSQSPVRSAVEWRHLLFTSAAGATARWHGCRLPTPEHVPVGRADVVAAWLAACRAANTPGLVDTNAASAVRVCLAAEAAGLAIDGSLFRVGGEPYSPGKAAVLARTGCRAFTHYSMSEVGRIANACACPAALDEVHLALDKVAILQRPLAAASAAGAVQAIFLTTLIRSTPTVMLNVEVGDYATTTSRECGCPWQALGFTQHLQDIGSYEKLTAEGMHFLGSDLVDLLEGVLPAAFGGGPTDYQLIEGESDGTVTVTLAVSPRVGAVDETRVVDRLLDGLARGDAAGRMMAARWREARTIRVARVEPRATRAGKVLALHVDRTTERHAS
jgi:hypothetical protein